MFSDKKLTLFKNVTIFGHWCYTSLARFLWAHEPELVRLTKRAVKLGSGSLFYESERPTCSILMSRAIESMSCSAQLPPLIGLIYLGRRYALLPLQTWQSPWNPFLNLFTNRNWSFSRSKMSKPWIQENTFQFK